MKGLALTKPPAADAQKFLVRFYLIGMAGFLLPWTKLLFVAITPLSLLFTTALLALYHGPFTRREGLGFALIFLLGFGIEAVGVNSGLIFGSYHYGETLGPKLLRTPVLIGVNWLFLSYCTTAFADWITPHRGLRWVTAPSLMVAYDLMLERIAPQWDMWHWEGESVPVRNYLAWWAIALLFTALIKGLRIKRTNPLATPLFVCQFLFFAAIVLYYTLIR